MCSAASNRILKILWPKCVSFSHFKVSVEVGNPELLRWLKEQANKHLGSFYLSIPFSLSREFHLHVLKTTATPHHIFSAIWAGWRGIVFSLQSIHILKFFYFYFLWVNNFLKMSAYVYFSLSIPCHWEVAKSSILEFLVLEQRKAGKKGSQSIVIAT